MSYTDVVPKTLVTAKLAELSQQTHDLSQHIFYRKLLTIKPSAGNEFLGSVVDSTANAIPDDVLDIFSTTLDNLLSAIMRRPELFLPTADIDKHKTAILEYIDNPVSGIDYTVEPYRSVTATAEQVLRIMTIINVAAARIPIQLCTMNYALWLCATAVSSLPSVELLSGRALTAVSAEYHSEVDYASQVTAILNAAEAIAMIPIVFEHRLNGHPTALCILSHLLHSQVPATTVAKWLRHYFSVHWRDYNDYTCQDELLQRAEASYKRYHPIPMQQRGDLCEFMAEMGLHSRRDMFDSDVRTHTDYARWWANYYVWYHSSQPRYQHPDVTTMCQRWRELDEAVDVTVEAVRCWWQLWSHAVDYGFPAQLLSDLRHHAIELNIADQRPYTLTQLLREPSLDSAKFDAWHAAWQQLKDTGVTTAILYRQSRVTAAVQLNYRETLINTATLIADGGSLSPAGVWQLIDVISRKYFEGINVPGTTAVESGIAVAAPVFQMSLSSFHHAGSAKSNTVILKRIEEGMYATKTKSMDNPSMYIVPAGQLTYYQAANARSRFVTMVLADYVVKHRRLGSDIDTAWLRLELDITKMIQHHVTPYHIATQLAMPMRGIGVTITPSALHNGYIDVRYTNADISVTKVQNLLETEVLDQMMAVVVKGEVYSNDSVVTGVFPLAVDIWTRSVMDVRKVTLNGSTGSLIQLNELDMRQRGVQPRRIKRLLLDVLGLTSWMLPYYDFGGTQLVHDPAAPTTISGAPPPSFGWYLFVMHDYSTIPDIKQAISSAKEQDRKLEDDYEKHWREQEMLYIRPETKVSMALRQWHLETDGTALLPALNDPLTNPLYSYSSSIHEVNDIMGIAATAVLQQRNYIDLIKFSDNQIDWAHLLVLVNYQVAPGVPVPLNHVGYNKSEFNAATLAGNSYAAKNIVVNAASGQGEDVKGFASEVMIGKRVSSGTGMFDVVMTPEQHVQMKVRIAALKGITLGKGAKQADHEVEFNGIITEEDNDYDETSEYDDEETDDLLNKRSGNSVIQNDDQIMRFKGVRNIVAGDFYDDATDYAVMPTVVKINRSLPKAPEPVKRLLGQRTTAPNINWGVTW